MTNLVAIVARELFNYGDAVGEDYHGGWPNNEDGVPVAECTIHSYSISFNEPCLPYNDGLYEDIEDVEGLPWCDEYSNNGEVTHQEYVDFINNVVGGDVSRLGDYFENGTRAAVQEINKINKEIAKLVDRMVELSEPLGLEVTVDLGERGTLDLNGPWDSSSAYC